MMSKPLIVITGASSGIGKATAIEFSKQGHPLLLLARRIHLLEALNLPHTLCKAVDVTDSEKMNQAIKIAEEQYGPVECLINNAGVMLLGQIATQNPTEWQTMLDVNVMGLMNGIHCVLKEMISRNIGTIINISSIAGRKGFHNHAAYCATKFGVHAFSETLREEVSCHNVRVIVIAPGAVETELLSHTTSKDIVAGYQDWKQAIGGALKSEDVAAAIMYAYQQPQQVCVREIVLAPTRQAP